MKQNTWAFEQNVKCMGVKKNHSKDPLFAFPLFKLQLPMNLKCL